MKDNKEVGKLVNKKIERFDLDQAYKLFENLDNKKGSGPEGACIAQHVQVPMDKVERAIEFWKPLYFSVTTEDRGLNGAEAYDLGDPKLHAKPDPVPYIAQCNLMALEGIRMMNAHWPTVANVAEMMFGSEREKEVADFWKKTFAPTLFQAQWAWTGVMAVLAGEPVATTELLERYKDQLP
jgi:hypothetical protein